MLGGFIEYEKHIQLLFLKGLAVEPVPRPHHFLHGNCDRSSDPEPSHTQAHGGCLLRRGVMGTIPSSVASSGAPPSTPAPGTLAPGLSLLCHLPLAIDALVLRPALDCPPGGRSPS